MQAQPLPVGGGYAAAFLPAMLQGKEREECETRYILMRGIDSKNTTRFFQMQRIILGPIILAALLCGQCSPGL